MQATTTSLSHPDLDSRPVQKVFRDLQVPLDEVVALVREVLAAAHGHLSQPARQHLEEFLANGERVASHLDEACHVPTADEHPWQLKLRADGARNDNAQSLPARLSPTDAAFLNTLGAELDSHLTDPDYSVDVMATHVCLSTSQLQRRMRSLFHESPVRLIRRMRLEYAATLLHRDAGTISEIACASGFNSQSYFARAFKDHFGMTPSAYRKSTIGPTQPR